MNSKLHRLVANIAKIDPNPSASGAAGELFARKWFEREGLEYFAFPQSQATKPSSLTQIGGKRPDFAVALLDGQPPVYVDAKFHQTKDGTEFSLEIAEFEKYMAFIQWVKQEGIDDGPIHILFMLYPKEFSGDKFVWIDLDEIAKGELVTINDKPVRKISLSDRDGLWVDSYPA